MKDLKQTKLISYYDMAAEAHSALRGEKNIEIQGVSEEVTEDDLCHISKITILNEEGAKSMQRPMGRYITLTVKEASEDEDNQSQIVNKLAQVIAEILPKKSDAPLLICGIGNPDIAADALGEQVISKALPTRHLLKMEHEAFADDFSPVALVTPNVLGNTGVEALELIQGIVEKIKPSAALIIDALSTSSFHRLGTSFQLSDTGLSPGGGIGNTRPALNEKTLGVPTIALGVPTVIYPQSIIAEVFSILRTELCSQKETAAAPLWAAAEDKLSEMMAEHMTYYAVTPKNIDTVVKDTAEIIAGSIQVAVHPVINSQNYTAYFAN